MKPGPKSGYKQTAEHIQKRKRFGAKHHAWKGEAVSEKGGRTRAQRLYPAIGSCQQCGNQRAERHHRDDNTANNRKSNIAILCRRCHMQSDGRLAKFKLLAVRNLPKARAARWR